MKKLELKIPPVVVVMIFTVLMIVLSNYAPIYIFTISYKGMLASDFAVIGIIIIIMAVLNFNDAKTTVNPTTPDKTSSIVDTGIYHYSRNPMYLGMLLVLIGVGIYLSTASPWVLLPFFVLYMNQYQIKPEEKMLLNMFGDEYQQYQNKVRRWI